MSKFYQLSLECQQRNS